MGENLKLKGGGFKGLNDPVNNSLVINQVKKEIVMRRIIRYFRWDFKYLPYIFKNGVINLIRYFKVIWYDRNHDYYYIFKLLKKKLEIQSKFLKKYGNHQSTNRKVEKIDLCIKLIDKIMNQTYIDEYNDYYVVEYIPNGSKKFGEFNLDVKIIKDDIDQYFIYRRKILEKIKKDPKYSEYSKEYICYLIGEEMNKKASKLLFKLIEENYEGWWY